MGGASKGTSLLAEHAESRENYDFQWGQPWGDLALTLDILGDLTARLGQHAVYCRAGKSGAENKLPSDLERMLQELDAARSLIRQILSNKNQAPADTSVKTDA